jgi:signal transduction histidine kinase
MNEVNFYLLVGVVAVILLSLTIVFLEHQKMIKTMKRLNQMLDCAISGNFQADTFEESLFSAVESRLNQYLTASSVSSHNITAEKEKIKELLADISHQTKTPIANILLYSQLMEEQTLPKESMTCVAALRGQAEKLSFLIDSLVKTSRLETGVITLRPVTNAIDPMLKEATAQFAPIAAQKGIQMTMCNTSACAVFDYKWTTEALCNLLDNAVKYTATGGNIQLSVVEYDLFCRIDVADSGIGILEIEQAKVFSRFYRSPAVASQDGVGIGLYLTRQILAGQEGYIKVTSSPGMGSVFSLFLPREN